MGVGVYIVARRLALRIRYCLCAHGSVSSVIICSTRNLFDVRRRDDARSKSQYN